MKTKRYNATLPSATQLVNADNIFFGFQAGQTSLINLTKDSGHHVEKHPKDFSQPEMTVYFQVDKSNPEKIYGQFIAEGFRATTYRVQFPRR